MTACDKCLRRTALIADVAGSIEIEWRARRARSPHVLALDDEALLDLAPGPEPRRRYEAFDAERARAEAARAGIAMGCRCSGHPAVHARLADLHDPPAVVHSSDADALAEITSSDAVAVVGARRASRYGLDVARSLSRGLAEAGVPVISGMALGIDSEAHRGALDAGGLTIAVLAGGVDVPYPARARDLHAEIRTTGAVVSEFPPGFRGRRWCFPARNRIIAALASMVVVVEGAERSGSLITADFAAQLGRGVAAVPGPVTARLSVGVNALIRAGAAPVRHVQDVLDEVFGPGTRAAGAVRDPARGLSSELRALLDRIEGGEVTLAMLVRRPAETASVVRGLAELELRGLVRREGGAYARVVG